jgi:putative phosphonate catabolism associated alcohol dehydrogenase
LRLIGKNDRANVVYAQVFSGPNEALQKQEFPLPAALAAGEVLVEISLATICGSDLHTLTGQRLEKTPCILGHEAVGRIVAFGSDRSDLELGQRVTWSIADSCGTCPPCREHYLPEKCHHLFKYGHAPLADGSGLNGCYASHILLRPGTHIVPVPDELPDSVVAPANCALATVINAVSLLPIPCRSVLIQGAGLLGLYACALLIERGVERVYCMDRSDQRRQHSAKFGATPIEHVGQISAAVPDGIDAVIEVAGASALVNDGIAVLRPGGFYAFVGMVHPDTRLEITGEQIIRKCLYIRGVHNYSPRHLDEAIHFLQLTVTRYPYAALVSEPVPLDDLQRAIALAHTQRYLRVAVRP